MKEKRGQKKGKWVREERTHRNTDKTRERKQEKDEKVVREDNTKTEGTVKERWVFIEGSGVR